MTHTQKHTAPNVTKLQKASSKSAASRKMTPFNEFENFFNHFSDRDWMHPFHWPDAVQSHIPMFAEGKLPKVDIIDNDKDLLIRAELPGVDKRIWISP